jgi:hypothetical protein
MLALWQQSCTQFLRNQYDNTYWCLDTHCQKNTSYRKFQRSQAVGMPLVWRFAGRRSKKSRKPTADLLLMSLYPYRTTVGPPACVANVWLKTGSPCRQDWWVSTTLMTQKKSPLTQCGNRILIGNYERITLWKLSDSINLPRNEHGKYATTRKLLNLMGIRNSQCTTGNCGIWVDIDPSCGEVAFRYSFPWNGQLQTWNPIIEVAIKGEILVRNSSQTLFRASYIADI